MAYKLVSAQVRIPRSWSTLLKKRGSKMVPTKTREAFLYEFIKDGMDNMLQKEYEAGGEK